MHKRGYKSDKHELEAHSFSFHFSDNMNSIAADNFPSQEYEFNTSRNSYPKGAKCQHDADIYKDELFCKLLLCPLCGIIVAVYNEDWYNTSQTYYRHWRYVPGNHPCQRIFYNMLRPGERR